jgi:hypothetical protein
MYDRFRFGHSAEQHYGSKSQTALFGLIKTLFPDTSIYANFILPLEEKKLASAKGLQHYEFDVHSTILRSYSLKVFLPQLALALEYQGETHYISSPMFGRASDRQRADNLKSTFAKDMGITLLSIPFWWDKSPSSLASTIELYRPDIHFSTTNTAAPIPAEKPTFKYHYSPNAPKEYKGQIDPTGW